MFMDEDEAKSAGASYGTLDCRKLHYGLGLNSFLRFYLLVTELVRFSSLLLAQRRFPPTP
jgi:hypothetical protein